MHRSRSKALAPTITILRSTVTYRSGHLDIKAQTAFPVYFLRRRLDYFVNCQKGNQLPPNRFAPAYADQWDPLQEQPGSERSALCWTGDNGKWSCGISRILSLLSCLDGGVCCDKTCELGRRPGLCPPTTTPSQLPSTPRAPAQMVDLPRPLPSSRRPRALRLFPNEMLLERSAASHFNFRFSSRC